MAGDRGGTGNLDTPRARGGELQGKGQLMASVEWTFLTNHAHVLICIARDPSVRLRDVAETVGITERATQRIVADLCNAGFLTRTRVGRRNQYEVNTEQPLRHPIHDQSSVSYLLRLLAHPENATK